MLALAEGDAVVNLKHACIECIDVLCVRRQSFSHIKWHLWHRTPLCFRSLSLDLQPLLPAQALTMFARHTLLAQFQHRHAFVDSANG